MLSPEKKHYARRPTEHPHPRSHRKLCAVVAAVCSSSAPKQVLLRSRPRKTIGARSLGPIQHPLPHRASATLSLLRHGAQIYPLEERILQKNMEPSREGRGFRRVKLTTSAAENKKKERHQMLGPVIGYTRALKKKKKNDDEKKTTICA